MIVGLDTSVVVRLLSGEPENLALVALRDLRRRQRRRDRVIVSDLVLAETYFALQHHYRTTKKATLEALHSFLETPGIQGTGDAVEILSTTGLESAKPGFVDRLIRSDYLRTGADEVVTFEKAGSRMPKVHVLKV